MNTVEILMESARYYAKDPDNRRAVVHGACEYQTEDGRKCGVGRCLNKKWLAKLTGYDNEWGTGVRVIEEALCVHVDEMLMPRYRGHPVDFWEDVQSMHDREDYWTANGMSYAGKYFLEGVLVSQGVPEDKALELLATIPGEDYELTG